MAHRRKRALIPILFIIALVGICIFIIGQRYGRYVAQADKTLSVLLTVTPTKPAPTNTPEPTVGYRRTEGDTCGLSYVVPTDATFENESSRSALLYTKGQHMEIKCDSQTFGTNNQPGSPITLELLGREVQASEGYFLGPLPKKVQLFSFTHPRTGQRIHILGTAELVTLFRETVQPK